MRDLGLLPGFVWGFPVRINDRGEILCSQFGQDFSTYVSVLYSKGGMINLTEVLGERIYPASINNNGAIVGGGFLNGASSLRAFTYANGALTELGALAPGAESFGLDINDSGEAVGYAVPDPANVAVFHAVRFSGGQVLDLGILPGMATSSADRINRVGHIIGNSSAATPERFRGFLYCNGVMKDIGALPGDTDSLARAFNNHDHIVGLSSRIEQIDGQGAFIQRAVLWIDGRMWDLNALIPRRSRWTLYAALGINDRGEIIAVGENKAEGFQRTCLLSPVHPFQR